MTEPRIWTPREYQPPMIQHMLDLPRCGVLAGMGLGKTCSTLTAISALELTGESQPTLILAPLRVARSTWPEEARKWRHLRHLDVMPIVGSQAERLSALRYDVPIYTCNYDNLAWLVDHFGDRWPFKTVVADEFTRLKGFRLRQGGKRAQALSRQAHTKIKRFIGLTGTPAPNGLIDLWGQMFFLDAGQRLGRTFTSFTDRWFRPAHNGFGLVPLPHAQDEIHALIADICLSIDAKDYFDLKDPIVTKIYVDMPVKAKALYRDMEKEMFMQLEGHEVEAFNAAAKTVKCLQIANGAAYIDDKQNWKEVHDAKLQALDSIVEEANGAPILVAYHFKSDLARLQRAFPKGRVLDSNPQTLKDWNEGKIPILFAHPASAGHGLNLQDGGNILVFFSHWWNLEEFQQIIERIGPTRQAQAGHDRPVFIYHIIAEGTVDELVMERRDGKKEIQDLLLEYLKRKK